MSRGFIMSICQYPCREVAGCSVNAEQFGKHRRVCYGDNAALISPGAEPPRPSIPQFQQVMMPDSHWRPSRTDGYAPVMAEDLMSWVRSGELTDRVHLALKAAFTELIAKNPDQSFYAFGLFTDDSLQFLHPVANTEESLTATVQHYRENVDTKNGSISTDTSMRWSYGDWDFFPDAGGGHFTEINEVVRANFDADASVTAMGDDEWTAAWNAIQEGFRRLDAEEFFGRGSDRAKVTLLLVGDLPEEMIDAWALALNPKEVAKRYLQWETGDLNQSVLLHEQVFIERGYRRVEAIGRGPTYSDGGRKYVVFDRVRGSDLRCLLGDGPGASKSAEFEVEGESPWWRTEHGETVSSAVAAAVAFLVKAGFSFLDDPLRLTPTEWRERHGIVVRDRRRRVLRFSVPAEMSQNRVVIACVRAHPALRGKPAMKAREILGPDMLIPPVYETLAFALEIKRQCEAEGLVISISE